MNHAPVAANQLRHLPRDRQELLRRDHRHPAHAGAGSEPSDDRRLRQLPQLRPPFSGGVTGKPPNHIPTTQPCTLCHTTPDDYAVGTMNHAGITSGCATCHAAGLSFANIVPRRRRRTHIPTTQACETCHSAEQVHELRAARMNHSGITSGCATCHATGKSFFGVTVSAAGNAHPDRRRRLRDLPYRRQVHQLRRHGDEPCPGGGNQLRHLSRDRQELLRRDHRDPAHAGPGSEPSDRPAIAAAATPRPPFSGAVGKPPNHIPTTQPCTLCHSNPNNYTVGTMNHAGISSGCATCHAAGLELRQHRARGAAGDAHSDHAGLRDLSRAEQLHELRRHA